MKKIILIGIFILQSLFSYCQIIDGIGEIRLGMTTAEVAKVLGKKTLKFKEKYAVTPTYEISNYVPVKGYYIRSFKLQFYQDSLYYMYNGSIYRDGRTNIGNALTIKYGEPKEELKTYDSSYVNEYGIVINSGGYWTEFTWDTGSPDIRCTLESNDGSSYGGSIPSGDFSLINLRVVDKIAADEKRWKKKAEERRKKENEEKKSELDGL